MTKATKTATATAATGHYADKLAKWPTAMAGKAPSAAQFKQAHELGVKPGTKTAVAIAMMLRPKGATQAEIVNVNGGAYLNKARELVAAKRAVREPLPRNTDGHTVYKLALADKPASKPRKAKAKATAKADTTAPAAE